MVVCRGSICKCLLFGIFIRRGRLGINVLDFSPRTAAAVSIPQIRVGTLVVMVSYVGFA